ncbi:hypothetical protein Tco_0899186 [Tanacetum coccineum]
MKKFPSIPPRIKEDYHSIKDVILWVSVYTTGNVTVRGMLILDAFLTAEICATDDFKEYEMMFVNVAVPMNQPQPVVSTQGMHRSTPRAHRTPTLTTGEGEKAEQSYDDVDDSDNSKFWKVHKNVDQVLLKIVPQLAERATEDFIENNLKPCIAETIIEDRDAFQSERKFEKSSTSNTSCRDDAFQSQHHDDHQDDDAPPEGEKRVKRQKTSKSSKSVRDSSSKRSVKDSTTYVSKQQQQQEEWDAWVEEIIINEDEVIPEDETPKIIIEFQNVDKRVPTIFDRARMEATLNDILSN